VKRLLRTVLLALLISFLVGLAIGTLLRRRLERPTFYLALDLGASSRSSMTES
jgi:hypothetical protein